MGFRENLQHLRATRHMTQEQLAMLVGVSRQSVTKWESGNAYPEMDKLIKISQIFDCSLDDLINGDLTTREDEPALAPTPACTDVTGYDEHQKSVAWRIALGVFCIIIGVALSALLAKDGASDAEDAVAVIPILLGVAVGLIIIIPTAFKISAFQKAHPFIEDFYTDEDRTKAQMTLGYEIAGGIALILVGVAIVVFVQTNVGAAGMLACVAFGVGIIIHGGIYGTRVDIEDYNIDALAELTEEEVAGIVGEDRAPAVIAKVRNRRHYGSICGIIMIVATIVGLCLLFWGQSNPGSFFERFFWLAWVVGGLLCGVVGAVSSMNK